MSAPADRPIDVLLEGGHALRGVVERTRRVDRDRVHCYDCAGTLVVLPASRVVAHVPAAAEDPRVRPTLDRLLDDAEWDAIERLGADLRACARRAGGAEADVRASVLADLLDRLVVAREEEQRG